MRLRTDSTAASPLVVIATFVLGAVVLTAGAYALFVDRPDPALGMVQHRDDAGLLAFNVTTTRGGLDWSDLKIRFLDPAGIDQAANYLIIPGGKILAGDAIHVNPQPPAGRYLLLATLNGNELVRLVVQI